MSAAGYQGPQAPQKKTSPWIFVLIGCGGLIVIGGLIAIALVVFGINKAKEAGFDPDLMRKNPALAMAKVVAAVNPDVEVVSVDERAGRITLREKSSGKVVTMDLEDVKQGRIVFETEEGRTTIEGAGQGQEGGSMRIESGEGSYQIGGAADVRLPAWYPSYPGARPEGLMSSQTADGTTGTAKFETNDSVEQVMSFYKNGFERAGLTVNTIQHGGAEQGAMVTGSMPDESRSAMVMIGRENNRTTVAITYVEK